MWWCCRSSMFSAFRFLLNFNQQRFRLDLPNHSDSNLKKQFGFTRVNEVTEILIVLNLWGSIHFFSSLLLSSEMADFVPEWDEATNIKLGAKKVSSVVISSSISISVTMRLLKRQMNRTKAEPRTWTFNRRRNSDISRKGQIVDGGWHRDKSHSET